MQHVEWNHDNSKLENMLHDGTFCAYHCLNNGVNLF